MSAPIVLIMGIAAGRVDDLLRLTPLKLTGPRELTVGKRGTFRYTRVQSEAAEGETPISAVTIAGRPSSGTGEKWWFYVLQPDTVEACERAMARLFKEGMEAWAAAQPRPGGLYHILGPYTPDAFRRMAPAAVWEAVQYSWSPFWRADDAAEQQGYDDSALDDVIE